MLSKKIDDMLSTEFIKVEDCLVISPKPTDDWPSGPPCAPNNLTMKDYFIIQKSETVKKDSSSIERFVSSFSKTLNTLRCSLELEALKMLVDMEESTRLLARKSIGEDMTESDIRVSRIDPLVKGICRCTDASFKTECITKTDGTKQETYQAYVQTTKLSLYEMQRKIEQIERIAAAEQKKTAAEQKIAMELIGKLQKQVHQLSERFDTPETDMSKADMSGKKRRLK